MIHQCVSENTHSAFYHHQKWHNILVSCTSSSNDTYSSGITIYPTKGRLWNSSFINIGSSSTEISSEFL